MTPISLFRFYFIHGRMSARSSTAEEEEDSLREVIDTHLFCMSKGENSYIY